MHTNATEWQIIGNEEEEEEEEKGGALSLIWRAIRTTGVLLVFYYFDSSMQRGLPLTMTLHFNCHTDGLQRLQRLVCHVAFSRVLLQSSNEGRKGEREREEERRRGSWRTDGRSGQTGEEGKHLCRRRRRRRRQS